MIEEVTTMAEYYFMNKENFLEKQVHHQIEGILS